MTLPGDLWGEYNVETHKDFTRLINENGHKKKYFGRHQTPVVPAVNLTSDLRKDVTASYHQISQAKGRFITVKYTIKNPYKIWKYNMQRLLVVDDVHMSNDGFVDTSETNAGMYADRIKGPMLCFIFHRHHEAVLNATYQNELKLVRMHVKANMSFKNLKEEQGYEDGG